MRNIHITTLEELGDYGDRWEALRQRCGGTIHTSYALSRIWLDAFQKTVSPSIVIVEEAGDLVGIAPFSLQRSSIAGLPIRMLSLIGDADMRLGLNPLRVLYEPGRSDVLNEIMDTLKRLDWNILRAHFMDDTEDVRRFLSIAQETWSWDEQRQSTTITCPLPRSGDVLDMFGKKTRAKIRQQVRRGEEGNRLKFRVTSEPEMDQAVSTHARQHIERWETKGGSIFQNPENVRFLNNAMKEARRQGFGYGYELLIDDQVAAQQFNFYENGMAYGYRAGMNNAFADHSPGWTLNYYALSDMMEKGAKAINLGEGGEDYKQHMGGQEASLIGLRAKRGAISLLSRLADSSPVQIMDARLGIRRKLLKERQR